MFHFVLKTKCSSILAIHCHLTNCFAFLYVDYPTIAKIPLLVRYHVLLHVAHEKYDL